MKIIKNCYENCIINYGHECICRHIIFETSRLSKRLNEYANNGQTLILGVDIYDLDMSQPPKINFLPQNQI